MRAFTYSISQFFFLIAIFAGPLHAQTLSNAADVAVKGDIDFFFRFYQDLNTASQRYNSYMKQQNVAIPETVVNYYYRIAQEKISKYSTEMSTAFPFTQFETFAQQFPWYSSLLKDVSKTAVYVPDDFTSSDAVVTSILSADSEAAKTTVTLGATSQDSLLSGTSSSEITLAKETLSVSEASSSSSLTSSSSSSSVLSSTTLQNNTSTADVAYQNKILIPILVAQFLLISFLLI